jgi:hypothetical protein
MAINMRLYIFQIPGGGPNEAATVANHLVKNVFKIPGPPQISLI